jgi:hypothetical protein
MEKHEIEACEKLLELINNDLKFIDLDCKDIISKVLIFQNFGKVISKYKNAPKAPVKEDSKPIKKGK